ncbi:hypothetical protein B4087_5782 [Bacillus cereus]|nr:hypothetical protein B4087_5782 [Bacillus cereus]
MSYNPKGWGAEAFFFRSLFLWVTRVEARFIGGIGINGETEASVKIFTG